MRRYKDLFLPERKQIFHYYLDALSNCPWAVLPPFETSDGTESSYHLFMLRIKGITEEQRDRMIQYCGVNGVAVNVHYIPMASLTLFKQQGYNAADYPNTIKLYKNEITLPIYNNLTKEQLKQISDTLIAAYQQVLEEK